MKTKVVLLVCALSLLSIRCSGSFAAEKNAENKKIFVLKSAKLSLGSPRKVPLNQDYLMIDQSGSGKKERIPVILVGMGYNCIRLRIAQGEAAERGGGLICYELRSKDKDTIFTWAMWSVDPVGHFRLFTNEDGKNYFAWAQGGALLYFTEISKPRDRVVALTDYLLNLYDQPSDFVWVDVFRLIGGKPFRGGSPLYSNINVLSIEDDDKGNITIKFTGTDKDKVYTLIREKGKWYNPDEKKAADTKELQESKDKPK